MKISALPLFAIVLALSGCSAKSDLPQAQMVINQRSITMELAIQPAQRYQGLSGRAALPVDQGMLFVFDRPDYYGFVMRDMLLPLDFIWINQGRIVDITANVSPEDSTKTYYPKQPVDAVLEIAAGSAQLHGWTVGQVAAIQ